MIKAVPERSTAELARFSINRTVTPESVEWAAANLADLPTAHTVHPDRPVRQAKDAAGTLFRKAFTIVASPSGMRRFNVHLLAGASSADLEHARRLISNAKAGHFNADLWRRRDERSDWIHSKWWQHVEEEHCDELRECAEAACVEQFHRWVDGEQDDPCALETIHAGGRCGVYGFRMHGGEWEASVSILNDPPEGPAGLRALRDLSNDYAWMQAECDKLNALARHGASMDQIRA